MSDRPAKILIVDDEEQNLSLIQEVLVDIHCVVAKARDGIEALDKFDKFQPDLVLLDVMLPRLSGLEVCARLKRDPNTRAVPVLVLTSLDELPTHRQACRSGADDFLTKPFDNEVLLHRVRLMLRESARRQAIANARRTLAEALDSLEQARLAPSADHLSAALDTCKRLDQTLAEL
jgi:sigma-B regulation protein RsbU (phosphoserine phosphatase)